MDQTEIKNLKTVQKLIYKALDGILEGNCKLVALSALEDSLLVLEPIIEEYAWARDKKVV